MIHYELILLYACGVTPNGAIAEYGYSRTTAYRFYRIYRDAGKQLTDRLRGQYSIPSGGTKTGPHTTRDKNLQEKH